MQSETETGIRFATQTLQRPQLDPTSQTLRWQEGRLDIWEPLPTAPVAASASSYIQLIVPPDTAEEWDVEAIMVVDTAHIQLNDVVSFIYQNVNASAEIMLQRTTGALLNPSLVGPLSGATAWLFPNKESVFNPDILLGFKPRSLLVRLDDSGRVDHQLSIFVETTATVGSRQFRAFVLARRRRRSL